MLSFRNFLLLLALFLGRELAPLPEAMRGASWLVATLSVVANLFVIYVLTFALSPSRSSAVSASKHFATWRPRIEIAWLVGHPLVLWFGGWFCCVNLLAESSAFLAYLALMLPSLLALAMLDMAAGRADSVDLQADPGQTETQQRRALTKVRLRLGELAGVAMCLTPVFFSAAVYDLSLGFSKTAQVWLEHSELGSRVVEYLPVAFASLALLGVLALFPWFLSIWAGVRSLAGSTLGARVEYFRERIGIGRIAVSLVASQGRWQGAAIVGWLPRTRRLWLGDGLLEKLTRRELDMVILHEMAHLSRRHFWWRALPLVWAVCINVCYLMVAPSLGQDGIPIWVGKLVALLLSGGVLVFGLGHISRSCELDADREACVLAEQWCPWAKESGTAHAVLATALSKLVGNPSRRMVRSWMHPSLHQRLVSLASVLATRHRACQARARLQAP